MYTCQKLKLEEFIFKGITLPGFFSRTSAGGCWLSGVDYLFIRGYLGLLFFLCFWYQPPFLHPLCLRGSSETVTSKNSNHCSFFFLIVLFERKHWKNLRVIVEKSFLREMQILFISLLFQGTFISCDRNLDCIRGRKWIFIT